MSFRFFTRKTLFPGVTLNFSKSGPSLSIGPRGLRHTIGPRGQRTTVGLPGTGLSYSVQHGKKTRGAEPAPRPADQAAPTPGPAFRPDPAAAEIAVDRSFLRAVIAYQDSRTDELRVHLADLDDHADAHWMLGICELRAQNWGAAQSALNAAVKHKEDLGKLCTRNGLSMEIAYRITPEITAHIDPTPRATRLALAEAYQADGCLDEALRLLKTMNRADPIDLVVALSLAEIAFEIDDGRKMRMGDLVKILEAADPIEGLAWARAFNRGRALERDARYQEAIAAYDLAVADPDIPEDMHKLARYERALTWGEAADRERYRQELSALYAEDKTFADIANRLKSRISPTV